MRRQHVAVLEHGHALDVDVRTDEELFGFHLTLAARAEHDHRRIERDERRRRVRRAHSDTTIGAPETMLTVLAFRRVRVARVAAGAIAVDTVTVVPAARVLSHVAADRAGVADLRARDAARSVGQQLCSGLE